MKAIIENINICRDLPTIISIIRIINKAENEMDLIKKLETIYIEPEKIIYRVYLDAIVFYDWLTNEIILTVKCSKAKTHN